VSVQRVIIGAEAPEVWATPDKPCFACGEDLTAGELAVHWMANDGSGQHWWHNRCAAPWAIAFMRDVWEAGHAAGHHPPPGPDKYAEPDWSGTS
jgi:hypothetical protein